jgi:RNA polymerase sigma factor (TIGR02999 family)
MEATPLLEDTRASAELRRTAEQLMPALYADVRRQARYERRRVGADQTMQTTALIHEAYLRLRRSGEFNDRSHFLRAAALAMRQVLVNYARDSVAAKRGGGAARISLDRAEELRLPALQVEEDQTLLAVHEALDRLAALSERLAQVVECRFFAGYSETETAEALGMNERTVRRDWVKARAWLRRELESVA